MSKDLHNMDDIFHSAYQKFEDEPSTDVWEKINAALDKKDVAAYKKQSAGWKRFAMLLILLLTGCILYETGMLKIGSGHSKENIPVADGRRKQDTILVSAGQSEMITKDHIP